MKNTLYALISILLVISVSSSVQAASLPDRQQMSSLRPQPARRLQLHDRLFLSVADSAEQAHQLYSNPDILADIERRLERIRESGELMDILDPEEQVQFAENKIQLERLERDFFKHWYLNLPMNIATNGQRWLTLRNSPEPQGAARDALIVRLQEAAQKNPLYSHWAQLLPTELQTQNGPTTWGELLLRFSEEAEFRQQWVRQFPNTLPQLKRLSEIWAWEDSSVRSVTVYDSGLESEHWVVNCQDRIGTPNRFKIILQGDFDKLVSIEYAASVYFNRLSVITKNAESITYHLEAIEKGRTMEFLADSNGEGLHKQTFAGAQLLRKSKADEFAQRAYVNEGRIGLFMGMRTMQLNQIQALMKINPELVLAVGQFGFSVTGGRAQTVSQRTDTPEEQMRKLTATLIDIIEFSNAKNVKMWFQKNTRHVLRAVVGGVGAGGTQSLPDPASATQPAPPSCRDLLKPLQ